MKATVLVNPASGKANNTDFIPEIEAKLSQHFNDVVSLITEGKTDTEEKAFQACHDGSDAIFAMGGDGTLRSVIGGILRATPQSEDSPIFGVIPGGTGNGFVRTIGLPPDPLAALDQINFDVLSPLSIGFVNGEPFTYTVTGGALPEGIRDVSAEDKSRYGFGAYVVSELTRLGNNERYHLRITVDGMTYDEHINSFVGVSANAIINHFTTAPDTGVDEPRIHVLALKDATFPTLLSLMPHAITHTIDENDQVLFLHGSHITVECLDGELQCGIDGDDGPYLPIELTIKPNRLKTFSIKEPDPS